MKTLPVEMETMVGGKTVKKETVQFNIMPPLPGRCIACGVTHDPREPHNAQSMYYQYRFYGEHGRWPTWADAVAHCAPEMQAAWKAHPLMVKAWTVPADGAAPIAEPHEAQP